MPTASEASPCRSQVAAADRDESHSRVFSRTPGRSLPEAARAAGAVIWDAEGNRYLDAAGGAIVVGIGHGRREVADAIAGQAARLAYAHGTAFTTEPVERYASELADLLPMAGARVYPVSGGSEAMETALKMARAYHLANGEPSRDVLIGRWGSYHGNTIGALDVSGREPLRAPYLPWLGRAVHVPAAYEYRCPWPTHPDGCGRAHAEQLERSILKAGSANVAAFVAEPIAGAALGAAVPSDDYWDAVADVCHRHDVLLIADEVMTGFGRTGAWFASDHWSLRPDILVSAKGASSGYWPLGFAAATGEVHERILGGGFVHGFTYSHNVVGCAVGLEVLRILCEEDLVETSRVKGTRLLEELRRAVAGQPSVGDVRGKGLMVAIELVENAATKRPFPRSDRLTERVVAAARAAGLLLYSSTGCADGKVGDLVMFGPPFVISDDELDEAVAKTVEAIARPAAA
jgi:adenosylmethionine-8-amino-7-oxononanoate aminotransferase